MFKNIILLPLLFCVYICFPMTFSVCAHMPYNMQLDEINKKIKSGNADRETLLERAVIYRRLGDDHLGDALKELDKLLRKYPKDKAVWFEHALTEYEMGKYELAIEGFTQAIGFGAHPAKSLAMRARSHRGLKRYKLARKDFNGAAKYDQWPEFYLDRGALLETMALYDEGVENYVEGLKVTNAVALRQNAIRLMTQQKHYDGALLLVNAMLVKNKFVASWRLKKSEIYEAMGERDKALASRQAALAECEAQSKTRRYSHLHRIHHADILHALGRSKEARVMIDEVLKVFPHFSEAKKISQKIVN